ncbi:GNAT family N-acetyltransferase [Archangium gephyra]|uniref:GNAT family N-acetyltransferase n=1 Tax=Archangium gephyra TaxID=48 RepID=UPI0035D444A8
MILYDENTIADAPWPGTEEGRKARDFLVPLFQQGAHAFFEDRSTLRLLALDELLIPLSINDAEYGNSYFFSPFARYITSQRALLKTGNWKPLPRLAMGSALWSLGALLQGARINKVIHVDNWPTLRNMGAPLTADQVRRLTEFLTARYPQHALVFPALSPATHAPLCNHLKAQGYAFAFMTHTRVLLPHGHEPGRKARENRRRDARLLETSGYQLVDAREMPGCAPRLAELYRMLNREKYATNPPITPAFFEAALRGEMIQFRLLVKDGRIDSFYGFHVKGDVLFSPAAGYELSLPQELGLYRILNNLLMQEALDRGIAIETGGGADPFKSHRGDRPVPRYNAVYSAHLPAYRQAGWRLVRKLANDNLLPVVRSRLRQIDGEDVAGFDGVPETFAPPFLSPRESVAQVEEALEALRGELEELSRLEPKELASRLPALARKMDGWQSPPKRLDALRERLGQLEHQLHDEKRTKRVSARAQRAQVARQLLEGASKLGDALLVASHLGEESSQNLRTLAEGLRKAAPQAAVVLTATQGGSVVLVTAAAQELLQRGVDAGQLLRWGAPAVGAGSESGGPEVAWAEGSRPEGLSAVPGAVRQSLQERLG